MIYRFKDREGKIHGTGNPDRAMLWQAVGWEPLPNEWAADVAQVSNPAMTWPECDEMSDEVTTLEPPTWRVSRPAQLVSGLPIWLIVVICFLGGLLLRALLALLKEGGAR